MNLWEGWSMINASNVDISDILMKGFNTNRVR